MLPKSTISEDPDASSGQSRHFRSRNSRHDVAMTMMTSTNVVLFIYSIANDLRAQITAMKESVRSMRVERDVSSAYPSHDVTP